MSDASGPAARNHFWGRLLIEELARQGVQHVFVSPGSRNTPLSLAAWENEKVSVHVHPDERSSAFAALGAGKATGVPALWITTSGTAVANGHPAVVEADEAAAPLIMLTADRPPELRDTGANQTIRQPGMFGASVRWEVDLPPPSEEINPRMVLTTAAQACYRAGAFSDPGPVHINAMFREPLVAPQRPEAGGESRLSGYWGTDTPYTVHADANLVLEEDAVDDIAVQLRTHTRGLVLVGDHVFQEMGNDAIELGRRLGWPVLPDLFSHVRTGHSEVVAYYDLLLSSKRFRREYAPETVLHLGGRITSKRLGTFLNDARPQPYVMVNARKRRIDPGHRVTYRVHAGVDVVCGELLKRFDASTETGWRSGWMEANERVAPLLESEFEREELSEPFVARCVTEEIDPSHALFAGSSMPVRDLDAFASSEGRSLPFTFGNRGASGIDGTVSTAAGVARARHTPATVLVGDIALLHDLNGLAFLRSGPPVIVVVINNDGGGIFNFLPVAEHAPEAFEDLFGTPHGLSFEHAAAMKGLDYHHPKTGAEFRETYRAALKADRSAVIEVTTDRRQNRQLHEDIFRRVDHALGDG